MSRLPFQPTEDVVRSIPGLRVVGFEPGSPEAAVLANHFAGSLKQFYLGQARMATASGLAQWAKSIDRNDHQMRYLNQFGQETVELRVHPQVVEEVLGKVVKPDLPWDWAVVDFSVPLEARYYESVEDTVWNGAIGGFYIRCQQIEFERGENWGFERGAAGRNIAMFMSSEARDQVDIDAVFPDVSAARPMVALTDPDVWLNGAETRSGQHIDKISVRIDLRDYHHMPELTFEVYANLLDPSDDVIPEGSTVKYNGAILTLLAPGGVYHLSRETGFSVETIFEAYPSVAALSPTSGETPEGSINLSEAIAANYPFEPEIGQGVTTEAVGTYSSFAGGWYSGLNVSTESQPYWPPIFGETEPYSEDPDQNGIYKWRNAAWQMDGSGEFTHGVVSDPPPVDEDNTYAAQLQWAWLIFLPKTLSEAVDVEVRAASTMTISGAVFRGDPPWTSETFDIPSDPGSWYYDHWVIDGKDRFDLGDLGQVAVSDEQLDYTPDESGVFYVPEAQRDGRPYLGKLRVSPQLGYATFEPAGS